MVDPLSAVRTRGVPQSEPADPRQTENRAGGFTYTVDWEQQLTRFLILGTMGGTFYASEGDHTKQATDAVQQIIAEHGAAALQVIVNVSHAGRAPKQEPTMFALALAASAADVDVRRAAFAALPSVCRIGTHLFLFAGYLEQFRGWGPTARRGIRDWYNDKDVDPIAFQIVKYAQRGGWSHADLMRLAHPTPPTLQHDRLYAWTTGGVTKPYYKLTSDDGTEPGLPSIVEGYQRISTLTDADMAAELISAYRLPWETVPSDLLNERRVWEALLPNLPVGAMIRQLPRLTRLGLLDAGDERAHVIGALTSGDVLRAARVHPLNVLNALMAYQSGQTRSGGAFRPVSQIVDALDAAFYASFGSVTPVGKPVRLALDVSGSMSWGTIAGTSITPAQAAAALALITASTEPDYEIVAFSHEIVPVTISPRQRLDDVIQKLGRIPMGGTDAALPMIDAMKRQAKVDLFVAYTDNETWAGTVHPHVALQNYRDRMSRPHAGCATAAMTATESTISAADDPRMLDVVGFDLATPELISAFGRGEL